MIRVLRKGVMWRYNFFESNDQRIFKHIFFVNKLWCRGNIKSKISDKQTWPTLCRKPLPQLIHEQSRSVSVKCKWIIHPTMNKQIGVTLNLQFSLMAPSASWINQNYFISVLRLSFGHPKNRVRTGLDNCAKMLKWTFIWFEIVQSLVKSAL